MKSQMQYSKTQVSLLIHLVCQISKKLYSKSYLSFYVRTSLSADKTLQTACSKVDWSRKSEKQQNESLTFALRLFTLTRLPVTQMFLLFDKDYFYIQKTQFVWRVSFRNPQARAGHDSRQIPNSISKVCRNMSNVSYNQSSGCFYNK